MSLFQPLDEHERETLARALRHELYGKGEAILRAGDAGDSLYVIRSGEVSVRIGVDGLEKEVARLRAGDFFGEMSLLTGEPRHATVVALRDAECWIVDRAAFQQILNGKEALVAEIGKLLHERARELKGEQRDLSEEAARMHAERQQLLGRIKNFFGFA